MFLLHNRILLPFYYGYTNLLLDSFYIYNSLLTETLKESDTAQVFSEGKKKKTDLDAFCSGSCFLLEILSCAGELLSH